MQGPNYSPLRGTDRFERHSESGQRGTCERSTSWTRLLQYSNKGPVRTLSLPIRPSLQIGSNDSDIKRARVITLINLPSIYVVGQRSISPHRDTRFRRQRRDGGVVGRERLRHNLRDIRWRVHEDLHTSFGHVQ
jgi:hypothetical protein